MDENDHGICDLVYDLVYSLEKGVVHFTRDGAGKFANRLQNIC